MVKCVGYYRVSTDKQGIRGLGMEAQRKAVTEFMTRGTYELVGEFTEVESGRKNNRPELVAAFDL